MLRPSILVPAFFWSPAALSAVFTCTTSVTEPIMLDTDHPESRVVALDERTELRCAVASSFIECTSWQRSDATNAMTLMGGAGADPAGEEFDFDSGTGSVICKRSSPATSPTLAGSNAFRCAIADVTTGSAIGQFDLKVRGARATAVAADSTLQGCYIANRTLGCGESGAVQPLYFGSELLGGTINLASLKSQKLAIIYRGKSTTYRADCSATNLLAEQIVPAMSETGSWQALPEFEVPASGIQTPNPYIVTLNGQLQVGVQEEGGQDSTLVRTYQFDNDFQAWGSTASTMPNPQSGWCAWFSPMANHFSPNFEFTAAMHTIPVSDNASENAGACVAWRSHGSDEWRLATGFPIVTDGYLGSGIATALLGDRLVLWGGYEPVPGNQVPPPTNRGYIIDPVAGDVTTITAQGAPSPRAFPALVPISANELIVWGGVAGPIDQHPLGDGAIFNLAAGSWRPVSGAGAHPAAGIIPNMPWLFNTQTAFAGWTGEEVLIWGGWNPDDGLHNIGHLYNPASDTWRPMAPGPYPLPTGAQVMMSSLGLVIFSPTDSTDVQNPTLRLNIGWIYQPATNSWARIPSIPGINLNEGFNQSMTTSGNSLVFGSLFFGNATTYRTWRFTSGTR